MTGGRSMRGTWEGRAEGGEGRGGDKEVEAPNFQ